MIPFIRIFLVLAARRRGKGKKKYSRNVNGVVDKGLMSELYINNPVFIFDEKDTSNCLDEKKDAAVIELWKELPDKIKELFQRAFTSGMPKDANKYPSEKERECQVRPSSEKWKEALQEWLKEIEGNSHN